MTLEEFTQYATQHQKHWRDEAMRLCRDPHAAEDALQEMWRRLLQKYEIIKVPTSDADAANPDGYAGTTLRNVIRDRQRRQASHANFHEALAGQVPEPPSDHEGDSASVAECAALVRAAVETMTTQERLSLRLSLCAGPAFGAQEMGKTSYTNALHRARVKMDGRLGQRRSVVLRVGLARLLALLDELLEANPGTGPNQS